MGFPKDRGALGAVHRKRLCCDVETPRVTSNNQHRQTNVLKYFFNPSTGTVNGTTIFYNRSSYWWDNYD